MSRGGVRILGGRWQGRRLEVPRSARPSESRVREALFSMWREALDGAVVLDLFAGSGAVGLEAVSRGAQRVTLVDDSRSALLALRRNVQGLGDGALPVGVEILKRRLPRGPGRPVASSAYDLIFADPPYDFSDYEGLLAAAALWARAGATLVVEHSRRVAMPDPKTDPAVWRRDRERRYGESCLTFYEHLGGESAPDDGRGGT